MSLDLTLYSDPGCPWAYSAGPALAMLRWRYGDQLSWRLTTVGLSEDTSRYESMGYTPERQADRYRVFRERFGMPFATRPRTRLVSTGRACRAIVATRLLHPGREFAVLRALQFAWFCEPSILGDTDGGIARAIAGVPGIDAPAVVAAIGSERVERAYQDDRAAARSAAGGAAELQGKVAETDGSVRFTAPSVVFERDGTRLEAGGFQSTDAYDVCVANLDHSLRRRLRPEHSTELLDAFPDGLCTAEAAEILAEKLEPPDREATAELLTNLVATGDALRTPLGQSAIWHPASREP